MPEGPAGITPASGRRVLPWLELAGLLAGFVVFSRLHDALGTDAAAAAAHAGTIRSIEATLHLDIEPAVNRWLAGDAALVQAAVLVYRLYYVPLGGVLLWVLFRHRALYPRVRWALIVTALLALLVFWLLPVSPPRFAVPGIVDVVADHDVLGNTGSRDLADGRNHFSALPSLHVGWSLLAAWAAWRALRVHGSRVAGLVWLFPLVMIGVVIGTGNHYLLDVAAAVVLVALAVAAASALEGDVVRRRRPQSPGRPRTGGDDDGSGGRRRR
ncbi:inositol phosphorylceramide synthase [Tersicoccus solisilvae]|uniref:Inositol phosphorylceramide synthase n=1 Tax=Tersicoccus solisilvae TaxID=1882339 RepID=A0ABQ1NWS3_9MICC|nr:phosphatase PAP2 family protein [Tersicoccus solisilvae]GGC86698.1 inositol phosphorylceramide synthase [Tersicoccus solisilvae]